MWRDQKYLLDKLLAARDAQHFGTGLTREAFECSRLHQRAIVNALQTVGEAARRVSQPTRDSHPEIPWTQIVGMLHWLVHDYGSIDLDIVWDVLRNDVPSVVEAIKPLVPPEPGRSEASA